MVLAGNAMVAAAAHAATDAAGEREHGFDHDSAAFAQNILPRLQDTPLTAIGKTPALSRQYCSLIRRVLQAPHPWQ